MWNYTYIKSENESQNDRYRVLDWEVIMYKVGVIGPHSSVERIIQIGKEYEQTMEFVAYPYRDFHETESIVRKHNQDVDVWLFSGQISYMRR